MWPEASTQVCTREWQPNSLLSNKHHSWIQFSLIWREEIKSQACIFSSFPWAFIHPRKTNAAFLFSFSWKYIFTYCLKCIKWNKFTDNFELLLKNRKLIDEAMNIYCFSKEKVVDKFFHRKIIDQFTFLWKNYR